MIVVTNESRVAQQHTDPVLRRTPRGLRQVSSGQVELAASSLLAPIGSSTCGHCRLEANLRTPGTLTGIGFHSPIDAHQNLRSALWNIELRSYL